MNKTDFNSALSSLMELAIINGNKLTSDEIDTTFKDILDSDDQYSHIYNYLKERNITISDIKNTDHNITPSKVIPDKAIAEETSASGYNATEELFLKMYEKDVSKIKSHPENIDLLLELHSKGDKSARNSLVEQHLNMVITIASQYVHEGIKVSDLIQEGNLALLEAIDNYNRYADPEFRHYIINCVSHAMESFIQQETGSLNISAHLVERVNALSDATEAIAEKYGRQATLEELCQALGLDEEEVRTIMKISLDALTIDESNN